jgi:predicted lysophospholipase L1 biosynthesis ABC-type transport system permease subunit
MRIKVDPSVIGQTRWYEYAIRFLFGGLIAAVAGIIAKKFGPGIGCCS